MPSQVVSGVHRHQCTRAGWYLILTVRGTGGVHFGVELLREVGGESNKGGASVNSSACRIKCYLVVSKYDLLKLDFPVCLTAHRDVGDVTGVCTVVDTTKYDLTTISFGVTEAEGEDRLVEDALVNHVVERRNDAVHGDGIVGKAEDTVEFGAVESGRVGGLCKVLGKNRKRSPTRRMSWET